MLGLSSLPGHHDMWPMTPTLPRQINTPIIYFLLSLILFLSSNQKIVFRFFRSQMSPIFWIQVAGICNYLFYHLPAASHYRGIRTLLLPAVSTNYPGLQAAPVSGSSAQRSRGSETKMMAVMCNVSVTPALAALLHHWPCVHCAGQAPARHNGTLYTGSRAICPASAASGQRW